MKVDAATLVDDHGHSLYGNCSACGRRVDNHNDYHRVSSIMRGGRGVECVLRGDIEPHEAKPLGSYTDWWRRRKNESAS